MAFTCNAFSNQIAKKRYVKSTEKEKINGVYDAPLSAKGSDIKISETNP